MGIARVALATMLVLSFGRRAAADDGDWAAQRKETFRVVWSTINESHFDPEFGGVDWRKVGERHIEQLPGIRNKEELRQLLHSMVSELGQSHFALLPREAMVYRPVERSRIGTTGLDLAVVENRVIVVRVHPASAAARAGLKAGMAVRAINDCDLDSIGNAMRQAQIDERKRALLLTNVAQSLVAVAEGVEVVVECANDDPANTRFRLTAEPFNGAWSEPVGSFPSLPLECETSRADDGTAYLRFNAFAPALMKPIRTFLRSLQPGDGLVIDLRGNAGGIADMASGIAGLLLDREVDLGQMRLRKGAMRFHAYPQDRAFLGPVALLLDGQSASTSEILAAGLRDHGRARLFGEQTAGAALPSVFRVLPTGDVLQYAVADVRRPGGAAIEGVGVQPDVVVARTRADVAAGRDVVREAASAWIADERRAAGGGPQPTK